MQKPRLKTFASGRLAIALLGGLAVAFIVLYIGSTNSYYVIQSICLLISMILIFYVLHPLAHYVVGLAYGVKTKYFFLGRSDFGKLGGILGRIGKVMPTIGTKFDSTQLAAISGAGRGFLFGSGTIVSNVALLAPLLLAIFLGFNIIALILGTLLLLGSLATELIFGTKVGDLYKMKREFSRS